jgi:hypothetical protein
MNGNFRLEYCDVSNEDVLRWWDFLINVFQQIPPGLVAPIDNVVYLYGWYEGNKLAPGPAGDHIGLAQDVTNDDRIIFPCVNGFYGQQIIADRVHRGSAGFYARISRGNNTILVPPGQIQVIRVRGPNRSFYFGHWVCIAARSLNDQDVIEFGGHGPPEPPGQGNPPFRSGAQWIITK